MPEIVDISLSDLLVDPGNARLKDEQANQQAALLALARQQGWKLLELAEDIVDHGLDPTSLLAVVSTDDQKKRYLVVEGNRRVTALKALETPSLVSSAFSLREQKKLNSLAGRFAGNAISSVKCALFDSVKEANHWITLRHTGQNDGIGLVEWGSDEKDRYAARHGQRSIAGQVLDFVDKLGGLSDLARESDKGIISSVTRLLSTPRVRELLGIEISGNKVFSQYPSSEVAKGLTCVIEDLKTGNTKVSDIYHAEDRINYIESLPPSSLPDPAQCLSSPQALDSLDGSNSADAVGTGDRANTDKPEEKPAKRARKRPERTAVIPQTCDLNISPPRINSIYNELRTLSVDQYANACSVVLRVFVELSVDHYISQNTLMTDSDKRNKPLAVRLKTAAADLKQNGRIDSQLETAAIRVVRC